MTAEAGATLESTLHSFMNVTAKSKVAVVVPLFGYWKDSSQQLDIDTLKLSLERLYSSIHNLYFIFVAEAQRLPDDVANYIVTKQQAGNVKGVRVKGGSSYPDYVRKGFEVALDDEAQYIVIANPWMIIQHNGLDILVDRINRGDAKIVSGFDVRGIIQAENFATTEFQVPEEIKFLSYNFFGMNRMSAEMIGFDEKYLTHAFLARDIWQSMYPRGFEVMSTQRIPIFSFEVDWTEFESVADFEADRAYFIKKWKFDPGIEYGKEESNQRDN